MFVKKNSSENGQTEIAGKILLVLLYISMSVKITYSLQNLVIRLQSKYIPTMKQHPLKKLRKTFKLFCLYFGNLFLIKNIIEEISTKDIPKYKPIIPPIEHINDVVENM